METGCEYTLQVWQTGEVYSWQVTIYKGDDCESHQGKRPTYQEAFNAASQRMIALLKLTDTTE